MSHRGQPASVPAIPAAIAGSPATGAHPAGGRLASWGRDFLLLTKARANFAVVGTAWVGYALQAGPGADGRPWLDAVLGTCLLASAASMANQAIEPEWDRRMTRTRNRPIATGRLSPRAGWWLSAVFAVAGGSWLGLRVNLWALAWAVLAYVVYVFGYTPLKRRTPACTLVGAVSGALPLLVGWAAAGTRAPAWGWAAVGVLFLWQIPHFHAIAWWRRADYLNAGYRVLDPADVTGLRAANGAVGFAIATVLVSLLPVLSGTTPAFYAPSALITGLAFVGMALWLRHRRTEAAARRLFLASLYYLPAIYALMLAAR